MRSKYVEINHILVNHLIKLNEDKQNNELLISKIKSLLKNITTNILSDILIKTLIVKI